MTNFPNSIDTDNELPPVSDNLTEIAEELINSIRSSIFAIENNLGVNAQGSKNSLADLLSVSLNPDGTIRYSALIDAGLVSLPIRNDQIASDAAIDESKLNLLYSTSTLKSLIDVLYSNIGSINTFIQVEGSKIEPHISGSAYNHELSSISVDSSILPRVSIEDGTSGIRDISNSFNLVSQISNDLFEHTRADHLNNNTNPPANQAHNASGIALNTSNFSFIPQTANDVQQFAQFIDGANILTIGTRTQTLFSNGIPRNSRSTALGSSDSGQNILPYTIATTYLLNGNSSSPVDSIDVGDDVILLTPTSTSSNNFDAAFSIIVPGDIATVNYGSIEVKFLIKEKKYIYSGGNKTFVLRINGKNLLETTTAQVKVDKALYNTDKQGVLALAQAPAVSNTISSSLIVGNPRGASTVSVGFNANLIDSSHYNLYLQLYPTGNPVEQSISLPAIDVSGNLGVSPGTYTLDNVVSNINKAFRAPGFNYRFIAFPYKGELGIMLADSINNASFSIVSAIVNSSGAYDQTATNAAYSNMNNAINVFDGKDALGLGPSGSNSASPPYSASYSSPSAALIPTKIFTPLTKKTFYVNGVEKERLATEPFQSIDGYGESYWNGFIAAKTIVSGARTRITYQVNLDLTKSSLAPGKTLVVQSSDGYGTVVDFGRFTIENVQFNTCNCDGYSNFAQITVYDGIHSTGITPYVSSTVGTPVKLYFGSDSISFNAENVSDSTALTIFKRWFEIFVDQNGKTFTYERGRCTTNSSASTLHLYGDSQLANFSLYKISPKLRGYTYNNFKKITLSITSYSALTGTFTGYLCYWDGSTESNKGPITTGKKGNVVRFYDETNIDYIDFIVDINDALIDINTTKHLDVQLFKTLQLDKEYMFIGSCQFDDTSKNISYLLDGRDFGNTSEEQFTNSALDYIAAPNKLLTENGIIKGFDITGIPSGASPYPNTVSVSGGIALINGKVVEVNGQNISVPVVIEKIYSSFSTSNSTINWFLCVNDKSELEWIADTNFINGNSLYESQGLNHNRIFYVSNPNTSNQPYPIKSTYFEDLVINYKNLTPIAYITSTVSAPSGTYVISSASYTDARRYISNGYQGLSNTFVLGNNANFRTLDSLILWLNQLLNFKSANNSYSNLGTFVKVEGDIQVNSSKQLNFNSKVVFEGNGGSFTINSATGFLIGSNVEFNNLKIKYNYNASSDSNFTQYNGSTYQTINVYSSALKMSTDIGNTYANATILKNVSIKNCIFESPYAQRFAFFSCNFVGPRHRVENLNITDNQFNYTGDFTGTLIIGYDYQAAIVIYSSNTSTASTVVGQRLVNCNILRNITNNSQGIAITATYNATNISDAIVPVRVNISENICGNINFCVKKDEPYYGTATNSNDIVLDKEASLNITKNNCRYIYTGNLTGNYTLSGINGTPSSFTGISFNTPVINISENNVGWIHTGINSPTSYSQTNPSLNICNNKFTAYVSDFLTPFGVAGVNMPALLVERGSNSSPLSSVLISGNQFSAGYYYLGLDGSNNNPTYYSLITNYADSNIVDNVISGQNAASVSNPSNTMMYLLGGSSVVSRNRFYRGSTSIAQYIYCSSALDQVIKDNTFDSPTIDGTNEVLVNGLTSTSIYESNKNQTKYTTVQMYQILNATNTSSTTFSMIPAGPTIGGITSGYWINTEIDLTSSSNATKSFSILTDITNIIPKNAKILGSSYYIFYNSSNSIIDGASTIVFTTSLNRLPITSQASYLAPSVAQGSVSLSPIVTSTTNITNASSTATVTSDYSSTATAVNTADYGLFFGVAAAIPTNATSGSLVIKLSPVSFKYRW